MAQRSHSKSIRILEDTTPTPASVLSMISRNRIVELGRSVGVSIPTSLSKEAQIRRLLDTSEVKLAKAVGWMGRAELKRACVAHELDASGHDRSALAQRLLDASAEAGAQAESPLFRAAAPPRAMPQPQDIVEVRHRQYLVEAVHPRDAASDDPNPATKVELVCLDDDNQGVRLEVLWELERGTRILNAGQDALQAPGLRGRSSTLRLLDREHGKTDEIGKELEIHETKRLDEPLAFAAYLRALQWNAVTATDAKLFQSPFRAGISLMQHQLTPLMKALSLPRANLLIADDVGLGKTIEAGLVMSELEMRQRVDFTLIVCPASICLQWRDEMRQRFGLDFAVFHRGFLAQRQRERGFGINAWSTHNRFIVSYHTLSRPEYLTPLLARMGGKLTKSMLVLDEAHTIAPASASSYAVDSGLTKTLRELAPRFENRLFLSATPHNGHSNSFSALLEMLDHQRFTRGIPIQDPGQLEPVMVRRLKKDLKDVAGGFPTRRLVQVELRHEDGKWEARSTQDSSTEVLEHFELGPDGGRDIAPELELGRLLSDYAKAASPKKSAARLVFVQLQKRLLSSIEAFAQTLAHHRRRIEKDSKKRDRATAASLAAINGAAKEDSLNGLTDDSLTLLDNTKAVASTALLEPLNEEALALLEQMTELCERTRHHPDAKTRALLSWIEKHQCPGLNLEGKARRKTAWTEKRVIIFTEYGDTKKYLRGQINRAIEDTPLSDERVAIFSGGMSDENRAKLQKAFTSDPKTNPVRILIATDAAREGLNLQFHCADLFHFDVPWNPARMEQRNGRIDRARQPEKEVRCHYFYYPQRAEDRVMQKLVTKVARIQAELGSMSEVIMSKLCRTLEKEGISEHSGEALDAIEADPQHLATVQSEFEQGAARDQALRKELERAARILDRSQKIMNFEPESLRVVLDMGLRLAGADALKPFSTDPKDEGLFVVPTLPDAWRETTDTLRPPRGKKQPLWEWRRDCPPLPVTFSPEFRSDHDHLLLHLHHPFVKRILSRFRAQGFGAHDLSRVTALQVPGAGLVKVVIYGRLSLYGPGAVRLHDELIPVAATWLESGDEGHLERIGEREQVLLLGKVDAWLSETQNEGLSSSSSKRLLAGCDEDFRTLWQHVQEDADALANEAEAKLQERAEAESNALRKILEKQIGYIESKVESVKQDSLWSMDGSGNDAGLSKTEKREQRQRTREFKAWNERKVAIAKELESEPELLRQMYRVSLRRLVPVGMVYLWPRGA